MLKISAAVGIISSLINRGDAELSFLDLRGIDHLVDHPGASPLYGYVALKTFLPNRRFLGNYGPGDRGLCGGKGELATGLRQKNDCPLDSNAELVQRLFPSPDGINFVTNQVPSDIITRLKPVVIGSILDQLARVSDEKWTVESDMVKLRSDLTNVMFELIHEQKYVNSRTDVLQKQATKFAKKGNDAIKYMTVDTMTLDDVPDNIHRLIGAVHSDSFGKQLFELANQLAGAPRGVVERVWTFIVREFPEDNETLDTIRAKLDEVIQSNEAMADQVREIRGKLDENIFLDLISLKTLKGRKRRFDTKPKSSDKDGPIGDKNQFEALASLIVDAVRESRGALSVPNGLNYPKYMPEHALLAFFVQRANSKQDLVFLFDGMRFLIKDSRWFNPVSRPYMIRQFVDSRWSIQDRDRHFVHSTEPGEGNFALEWEQEFKDQFMDWNPEKILFHFSSLDLGSMGLPRPVTYGEAVHKGNSYPDCGETSLRNFFNIMLYDSQTTSFNVNVLTRIEAGDSEVSFDPAIHSFYEMYPTVSSGLSSEARNTWGSTVVSERAGVEYKKEGYEIRSLGGPDNMLSLIGQLLFRDVNIRTRRWERQSREGKMDALCRIFSTPTRKVTWEYADTPKGFKVVMIAFKFNDETAFLYMFGESHFSVTTTSIQAENESWKRFFALEGLFPGPEDPRKFLVPLLVDLSTYRVVESHFAVDRSFRANLFYALYLPDDAARMDAFSVCLDVISEGLSELKNVARRLRTKLPDESDLQTARLIEFWLMRTGYPLGVPEHPRNRPDAVYRSVPSSELVDRFGYITGKRMGITFGRRPFGRSEFLITDLLVTDQDPPARLLLDQDNAAEACISLNPEGDRMKVREEVEAREAALRSIRRSWRNIDPMDCSHDGPIARIFNQYRVSGFYLLSMEEFGCLLTEMGSKDFNTGAGFIPQILPNLTEDTWTSSRVSGTGVSTWRLGLQTIKNLSKLFAVRCGRDTEYPV